MMWNHGMSWHTLVWIGMALFWLLIIVLALAPTKYMLAEANSADLRGNGKDAPAADSRGQTEVTGGASRKKLIGKTST